MLNFNPLNPNLATRQSSMTSILSLPYSMEFANELNNLQRNNSMNYPLPLNIRSNSQNYIGPNSQGNTRGKDIDFFLLANNNDRTLSKGFSSENTYQNK